MLTETLILMETPKVLEESFLSELSLRIGSIWEVKLQNNHMNCMEENTYVYIHSTLLSVQK